MFYFSECAIKIKRNLKHSFCSFETLRQYTKCLEVNFRQCTYCLQNLGITCIAYWAIQRSWFARVNALCNLSRKKSLRGRSALPGRFLSRRCFTLCITVEAEPRIAKQYKCQYCCSCKNYRGKGMEGGKKCLCVVFWLTRRSRVRRKNAFWGIL